MRTKTNAFIIVFFAIQLLLPLPGFIDDGYERRGRFSWNMYANVNRVRASYAFVTPEGEQIPIDYKTHFNNRFRATMVFHRLALPKFHAYLCEELEEQYPDGKLYGHVKRKYNDKDEQDLTPAYGVDLCTADNYGVLSRP